MDILHLTGVFGRLDRSRLDLSPGLNLLYAPNESGKSTWGAFIRTMLYGLSTRERGPMADKNRYAPWNGAPLWGRMELRTGDGPASPARTPAMCCWACPGRCSSAAPSSVRTP